MRKTKGPKQISLSRKSSKYKLSAYLRDRLIFCAHPDQYRLCKGSYVAR